MLHPTKYAAMLAEKMQKHGATGWLVNTGWSGGRCVLKMVNLYADILGIHYTSNQLHRKIGMKCSLNLLQLWLWQPHQVTVHSKNH